MKREDLADLMAFAVIAKERSFTRAGVKLGLSGSALSHAIRLLEERLQTKLLNRTTRSVSPTAAGERLLARLQPALADIDEGLEALFVDRDHPRGRVRINTHRSAATLHVMPKLEQLRSNYPDIVLELSIDDRMLDIVAAGFDAGIRHGELIAKDMIAVRIGPSYRTAVVASPTYLRARPKIETPLDLVQHLAIAYQLPTAGTLLQWEFQKDAQRFVIDARPCFISNDMDLVIHAALMGTGVAYLLYEQVQAHLESGALIEVASDWSVPYQAPYLYYPSRRQIRPAMRAVIDLLRYDAEN